MNSFLILANSIQDCTNGADERKCSSHMNFFKKHPKHMLDGFEVEKWLNTPAKTCAMRCKEASFTCRSFTHKYVACGQLPYVLTMIPKNRSMFSG